MREDGVVRQIGQISLTDEALRIFADSLAPEDEVAIEVTCNTHAIVRLLEPQDFPARIGLRCSTGARGPLW